MIIYQMPSHMNELIEPHTKQKYQVIVDAISVARVKTISERKRQKLNIWGEKA